MSFTADFVGRLDLAHEYLERLAAAIHGSVRRTDNPGQWCVHGDGKKLPSIARLLDAAPEWLAAIEHYTHRLEQAEHAAGPESGEQPARV